MAAAAQGMQSVCDGISRLSRLRDNMSKRLQKMPLGVRAEQVTISLQRAVDHLVQAAAELPDECWAAMLAENLVTPEQVKTAVLADVGSGA